MKFSAVRVLVYVLAFISLAQSLCIAQRGARASARQSVNRPSVNRGDNVVRGDANVSRGSASANRSVDANVNVNNVNVNRNVGGYYSGGCCYHPVAAAATVTAAAATTAAAIGSVVSSVPSSCTPVVVGGITYQQCGSTWYQPQFSGDNTTYVAVNPPQ
jgi:hypothetical protein